MVQVTKHGMLRDSQRQKVYNAEQAYWNASSIGNQRFESVADVETYVRSVMEHPSIVRRFGRGVLWTPITIGDGRGARSAYAYGGTHITVPRSLRKEWVLLHELAHILHHRLTWTSSTPEASHGWQWASLYIELVHIILGKRAADGLKLAFRQGRVRYNAPRKGRKLTPEQRAAAAERLARAREAKAANRRAEIIGKAIVQETTPSTLALRELLTF